MGIPELCIANGLSRIGKGSICRGGAKLQGIFIPSRIAQNGLYRIGREVGISCHRVAVVDCERLWSILEGSSYGRVRMLLRMVCQNFGTRIAGGIYSMQMVCHCRTLQIFNGMGFAAACNPRASLNLRLRIFSGGRLGKMGALLGPGGIYSKYPRLTAQANTIWEPY